MARSTEPGDRGNVTADEVAAVAGVSRWTVNRAFRPDASISKRSRERVMQAAQQLGYVPDLMASSLRSDRSNLVAVLVDDFANPHKLVMMERLTRILRKAGSDTLLVNMVDESDASAALLSASQRRVDATILIGSEFGEEVVATALGAQRARKLIVFARYSENPNTISICCDDVAAMTTITDFIMDRGYRNPLFLAGPQTVSAHLHRKETFLDLWSAKFGSRPESTWVRAYDPQLAYERVSETLGGRSRGELPDLLVCENDALAVGAIDAIRFSLGLRVPEDIAVTGFDDVPQASSPNYRLTTYRQPVTAMAEALAAILAGNEPSGDLSRFEGELVVRESA